jgi:hypothetical protein
LIQPSCKIPETPKMKLLILISAILCLSVGVRSIRISVLDKYFEQLPDLSFQDDLTSVLEELEEQIFSKLPQTVEELGPILHAILKAARNGVGGNEVRVPTGLIPPGLLPDPLPLPLINLTDLNLGTITGDLLLENAVIRGLGELTDDITAEIVTPPLGLNVAYKLIVPFLQLNGTYDFNLQIDFLGNALTLIGDGPAYISFAELALVFDLDIRKKTDSNFVDSSLELRIDGLLHTIFEGLEFAGTPVEDWEFFSNLVWSILYPRIEEILLIPIATNVTVVLNDLLKECTILDLLAFFLEEPGADLSCIPLFAPSGPPTVDPTMPVSDPTQSEGEDESTAETKPTTQEPNSSIRTLASHEVLLILLGGIRLMSSLY